MTMLIELGATNLIEMGDTHQAAGETVVSPILDLFSVVDYIEDPFRGVEIEPGESISPKQKAIAQRLRTIARLTRKSLASGYGMEGVNLLSDANDLRLELGRLGHEDDALGRFRPKKRLKKIGGKIVKVVKSPAFLSVVGVVANVIPGVGQVASAALLTTAGVMAKKQQQKKVKTAERQAAAEAATQDKVQLDAYYAQYGPTYMVPMGYTPEVWSTLSTAEKRDSLTKLSDGTLQPYRSPQAATATQADVAKAAGLSIAMQSEYKGELAGSGVDINALPPDIQAQAKALAPQYQQQINATGRESFLSAAMKAAGQGSAINDVFSSVGVEMPAGLSKVFSKLQDGDAKRAGEQDLLNLGAVTGSPDLMDTLLGRGGSFPYVPVAVGTVVVGGILYFILR
jgi:hypothetical protein